MSSSVIAALSMANRPQPFCTRVAEMSACGCVPAANRATWNGSWTFTSSTPAMPPSTSVTWADGPSTRNRSCSPPVTVADR